MPKSVTIYSLTYFPVLGGLERNTYTLAKTLKQLDFNVKIFTETQDYNSEFDSFNIPIIRKKSFFHIISALLSTDLLFVNGGVSLKVLIPAFFLRKKYFIIYHSYFLYERVPPSSTFIFDNSLRKFLAIFSLCNISVSVAALDRVKVAYLKTAVLLNPIDLDLLSFSELQNNTKSFDLLFSGRVIPGKGIFLLLNALEILRNRGYFLRLLVVGDGPSLEDCYAFVKHTRISVTFKGRLDGADLVSAYQQSSLLVVPSTSHIEGNPLVLAEAISLGTPVLVSDQKPMIEASGNAGYHFQSGDVFSLVSALELLFFKNDDLLQKMKLFCRIEKEKFHPDLYKSKLKHIIEEFY